MSEQKMFTYREAILDTLQKLIRVKSEKSAALPGMPFGEGPAEALRVFLEEASALGFRTGESNGYAGWLEFGPLDKPMVGAVCHLDVVPAQGWPRAYEPELRDGLVIGRGSMDDKGPAVAVLYAMKSLLDEGVEPACRIRLILGLDEESGSSCMAWYTEHEELPLAAFTADADFPVINGEKGHWTFDLVWDEDTRPEQGFTLWSAHNGTRGNVIPGEAVLTYRLTDGSFEEIETIGKMGHASMPQLAKNAIQYALADALARTREADSSNRFLEQVSQVLGTAFDGSGLGIAGSDEPSGELTLNVGIFDYNDGQARFRIDIRYPVTWDIEDLRAKRDLALAGTGFSCENEGDSAPLFRPVEDPLVQVLMEAYRKVSGRDDQPLRIGGGTYARAVPNTLAFGPTFPEDENLCHQKGEYITEDTLLTASGIYREALLAMAEHYGKQ